MSKKLSEGFTKRAQNTKFIRNRDIKLKGKEIKREQHVQKAMCEGVCKRCRDKVQWKFRYDKYKPLKAPATCQDCKKKCVYKAYRTLCDQCAALRKVCSSCCSSLLEEIEENEDKMDNQDEDENDNEEDDSDNAGNDADIDNES